jgi:F-type H+-transporting ATPase subunit gamma
MSRLIALRHRIKTVTTIQKTTHTMQLTAMSAHARLQKKKEFIKIYQQSIEDILQRIGLKPKKEISEFQPSKTGRHLLVVIGSQKGLCGAFNTRITHLFEKQYPEVKGKRIPAGTTLVCIGKKIAEYFERIKLIPSHSYPTFNAFNFVDIAHELERLIFPPEGPSFQSIIFLSNYPHTFFIQKTAITILHKHMLQESEKDLYDASKDPYFYEQPIPELRHKIQKMYFKARLEEILFQSLLAEQASRFIAMDSATRNAEEMLTDMQRDYNKLRQASITRELTDLAGSIL